MKFTGWIDTGIHQCRVRLDGVNTIDNDLLCLYSTANMGVIRRWDGILIAEIHDPNLTTIEDQTRRLLDKPTFKEVCKILQITTPHIKTLFPKKFMQQLKEFLNKGVCDVCGKIDIRTPNDERLMCLECFRDFYQ